MTDAALNPKLTSYPLTTLGSRVCEKEQRCWAELLESHQIAKGLKFLYKSRLQKRTSIGSRRRTSVEMPVQTPKIKVLIADDHAILRSGLKMLINAQADMEVVSEASNGAQAIQAVSQTKPNTVHLRTFLCYSVFGAQASRRRSSHGRYRRGINHARDRCLRQSPWTFAVGIS